MPHMIPGLAKFQPAASWTAALELIWESQTCRSSPTSSEITIYCSSCSYVGSRLTEAEQITRSEKLAPSQITTQSTLRYTSMLALESNAAISSSIDVNPGIPETAYVVDASTLRNVVLVAGCDFPPAHGISFKAICKKRFDRYLNQGPDVKNNPNWRFTIFDVPSGEVSENTFDPVSGKRAWKVVKTFSKVTTLNYSLDSKGSIRFNLNTAGVMSITDIYQHVRD